MVPVYATAVAQINGFYDETHMNGQFELNENSRVKQSIVICHMHTLVSFFLPHHWAMQNRFNHKAINACLNTQFSFDMKTLPFFFQYQTLFSSSLAVQFSLSFVELNECTVVRSYRLSLATFMLSYCPSNRIRRSARFSYIMHEIRMYG